MLISCLNGYPTYAEVFHFNLAAGIDLGSCDVVVCAALCLSRLGSGSGCVGRGSAAARATRTTRVCVLVELLPQLPSQPPAPTFSVCDNYIIMNCACRAHGAGTCAAAPHAAAISAASAGKIRQRPQGRAEG